MRILGIVALGAAAIWLPTLCFVANGTANAAEYPSACRGFADFLHGSLEQPPRPACVDSLIDRASVEMCRPLMDLYQTQIRQYEECLKAENDSIIDTYNTAVRRFNCAVQGIAC